MRKRSVFDSVLVRPRKKEEDESMRGQELLPMRLDTVSAAVSPPTNPEQAFFNLPLPEVGLVTKCTVVFSLFVGFVFCMAAGCVIGSWVLGALCVLAAVCAIPNNNIGDLSDGNADAFLYAYPSYY